MELPGRAHALVSTAVAVDNNSGAWGTLRKENSGNNANNKTTNEERRTTYDANAVQSLDGISLPINSFVDFHASSVHVYSFTPLAERGGAEIRHPTPPWLNNFEIVHGGRLAVTVLRSTPLSTHRLPQHPDGDPPLDANLDGDTCRAGAGGWTLHWLHCAHYPLFTSQICKLCLSCRWERVGSCTMKEDEGNEP